MYSLLAKINLNKGMFCSQRMKIDKYEVDSSLLLCLNELNDNKNNIKENDYEMKSQIRMNHIIES